MAHDPDSNALRSRRRWPRDLLEAATDNALIQRKATPPKLLEAVDRLCVRGRPGATPFRELARERTGVGVSESVLETRLLRLIRAAGLPLPVPQYEVRVDGKLIARVDFAYPDRRIALEADGYAFHAGKSDWSRNLARQNALTRLRWRMLHFTWDDVRARPETVIALIAELSPKLPVIGSQG
jgi:very-short-patch-repair endonuclease